MKLTIETASNGYVLSYDDELDDKTIEKKYIVVEEDPESADDCDTTQSLLGAIVEHFGLWGSKHDPRRISIEIEENENQCLGE
jgi:hypothetical protein